MDNYPYNIPVILLIWFTELNIQGGYSDIFIFVSIHVHNSNELACEGSISTLAHPVSKLAGKWSHLNAYQDAFSHLNPIEN